jgi:integrase
MAVKIRERPPGSGVFWVFIDHRGRRKSKKVGDEQTALEVARKIEAKLTLGDFGIIEKEKPKIPKFAEYAAIWLDTTVKATCKHRTWENYKTALNVHVLPVFKNLPVNEITRFNVKSFLLGKISKGFSAMTVNNMKNVISGVLNQAVDDGLIAVNPAQRLGRIFKQKERKLSTYPLSREETALLLKTFREYYSRNYPLALTLARTGMRIGEACALQWGDIDFNSRFIMVQRSISNNGRVDVPKNNRSRRVDMSKQLTETLLKLKRQRIEEKLKYGWKELPEWVFISETGTPIVWGNWRDRVFYKALDKAGLRRVRIHDMRHGFASQLLQAGEPLPYVKDQLGHGSIRITVDTYGHLQPGGNKDAVDRLDDDATTRNLSATWEDARITTH